MQTSSVVLWVSTYPYQNSINIYKIEIIQFSIQFYLHDCDGSDGGIREWIFVSKGSGSGAALREANFKGIHQAGNELNQL
jgi:hypothetical protein